MTNRILVPCIVALLFAVSNTSAFGWDEPMDVFKPLLGTWTTTFEIRPNQANPDKSTGTGELNVSMILGGRFVKSEGFGTSTLMGRQDYNVIMTYDERRQTYRRWIFRSDGVNAESTGIWNAEKKVMVWTTVGLPENASHTITTKFTDEGFEERVFGKRADGVVSMDVTHIAKKK